MAAALAAAAEQARCATFWVRWRDPERFTEQMIDVALACGLPADKVTAARAEGRSVADLVWTQLAAMPGWLLIIDNVDQPAALAPPGEPLHDYRGWIRPGGRGLLVVTSRDRDLGTWGDRAHLSILRPLADADGGGVLLQLAPGAGGSEDAARLSRRLGGFPLALDAAGSSLAQPTSEIRSFAGYAQALTTRFEELLATESPDADDPDTARRLIRYTWELSLDQLAAAGHAQARPILQLLSLFADAPIPDFSSPPAWSATPPEPRRPLRSSTAPSPGCTAAGCSTPQSLTAPSPS